MGHMSRVHAPPIGILKPFKVCSSTLNGFIRQGMGKYFERLQYIRKFCFLIAKIITSKVDTILLVGFEIGAAGTIHSASTLQLS
ncbi:hypothetical protein Plhal304r1_c008g0032411 [Plasmopara halstedii]